MVPDQFFLEDYAMRLFVRFLSIAMLALAPSLASADTDHGTVDEAKAMVERAVSHLKQAGADKAFADFGDAANKDSHDRDLYVFVRSMDGNTVAHGANKAMIGHTSYIVKVGDYVVGAGFYKQ